MDVIITLSVILGILLMFAATVLLITVVRTGLSIPDAIAYFRKKPVYKDWLAAGFLTLGIVGALGIVGVWLNKAIAADFEIEYLEYTEVYFGLDYQNPNPICAPDSLDNVISANVGLRQQLLGFELPIGRVDMAGSYTHHSCAIGSDDGVYDGFGLMMIYRIDWW